MKSTYDLGEKTIRRIIDRIPNRIGVDLVPQDAVCVFDATHLGGDLVLVARAPHLKANLGWAWMQQETKQAYALLKAHVVSKGVHLTAVVLDGRMGIPAVFSDMPVQICQFHQLQIVRRKLTLRPETEAGQELLALAFSLAKTDEKTFAEGLRAWHIKHETFINEKTFILGSRFWHYTHRRVRSAYISLKRNLPLLFTYQKYPALRIPNTTNSLDGYFSRLKNLLSAHRGKSKERVRKIAREILRRQTA